MFPEVEIYATCCDEGNGWVSALSAFEGEIAEPINDADLSVQSHVECNLGWIPDDPDFYFDGDPLESAPAAELPALESWDAAAARIRATIRSQMLRGDYPVGLKNLPAGELEPLSGVFHMASLPLQSAFIREMVASGHERLVGAFATLDHMVYVLAEGSDMEVCEWLDALPRPVSDQAVAVLKGMNEPPPCAEAVLATLARQSARDRLAGRPRHRV